MAKGRLLAYFGDGEAALRDAREDHETWHCLHSTYEARPLGRDANVIASVTPDDTCNSLQWRAIPYF